MAALGLTALAGTMIGGTGLTVGSAALGAASLVGTTVSMIGDIAAGRAKAEAARGQATEAVLTGGQTRLESVQRETSMLAELRQVLGENAVNFAAGGNSTTTGAAAASAARVTQEATREIRTEQQNRDFRVALYRARARGLRQRARTEEFTGGLNAIATGLEGALALGQIG